MNTKTDIPTYEEFKTEVVKRLEPLIEATKKHYSNMLKKVKAMTRFGPHMTILSKNITMEP